MVSIAAQIEEVQKEVKIRRWVYTSLVKSNDMTQDEAARKISTMEAVLTTLRMVQLSQSTQQEIFAAKE